MKKIALIYLGLVFAMMALMTGLPSTLLSWATGKGTGTQEVASAIVPVPAPTTEQAATEQVAAEQVVDNAVDVTMAATNPAVLEPQSGVSATEAAAVIAGTDPEALTADRLPKPMVRGGDISLDRTTSAILAELAIIPAEELTPEEAALRDMSSAAIGGIAGLRGEAETAQPRETLESLVVAALRAGQPDAYIDMLVNEAAGSGAISVPSALVTADGRVDTAVLLSTLVTKAQVASGAIEQVNPTTVVAGGDGVEVRVTASAIGDSKSNQFYTVAPGDSLGSIAQKFYGDAVYFPVIFEANRALLSSPDQVNIGQRLVVPPASSL